tara:strand:- start:355 stop:1194 length:840 start_codon:yes stop_codon:yes gene_type:complete
MKKSFNNDIKNNIAKMAIKNDIKGIKQILTNFIHGVKKYKKGSNEYFIIKFLSWLNKDTKKLPFNIFKIGNSKLPFLNFSTLPLVTCPGADECKIYCYSLKAWRYPAAFLSQVQNTLLLNNFNIIEEELKKLIYNKNTKLGKLEKIDFRLYVDGDFNNITILKNWMELLKKHNKIKAYGYSKSLNLFLQLLDQKYKFPENYALNLSNGGTFDSLKPFLINQHFVRGNFTAVKASKNNIRSKFKNKVFICPGLCGSCTNLGHACGNLDKFKNIEIVIPIH